MRVSSKLTFLLASTFLLMALCDASHAASNVKNFKPLPKKAVKPDPAFSARVARKAVPPATRARAKEVIPDNRVQANWTRVVRAADPTMGAYVAETLALVLDSQYLVVPWTFISEVWLNRPGSRIVVDGLAQEVALVDVDLSSNLALLKSSETVLPSFFRAEIRRDAIRADESFTVIAGRDWLMSGDRFIASKTDGVFTRYQMASTTAGASGSSSVRYVFDGYGRLAAVSHVGLDGAGAESVLSVPATAVFDLIHNQDGPRPASLSVGNQRRTQLYSIQGQWARVLLQSGVPLAGNLANQSFDCKTRLASIPDHELAAQVRSVRALDCSGKFSVPVVKGYSVGYSFQSGDANLASSDLQVGVAVSQTLASNMVNDLQKSASLVNLMTVPECHENIVENGGGPNLHVKFCTAALKFEPGLADTYISVTTVEQSQMRFWAARLRGFDQDNTRKVLRALVEKVKTRK